MNAVSFSFSLFSKTLFNESLFLLEMGERSFKLQNQPCGLRETDSPRLSLCVLPQKTDLCQGCRRS